MSDPYIGEIRMFAGTFAPRGWAFCDGQLIAISQYSALFSLLGTFYGGDGRVSFGLPDLRGRMPMHMGHGPGLSNRVLGHKTGAERATVTGSQLPTHTHALHHNSARADATNPEGNSLAASASGDHQFSTFTGSATAMNPNSVAGSGGGMSHDNMSPFLCIHFIIAMVGIYPSRS